MATKAPRTGLAQAIRSPGFTPAVREIRPLLDLLAATDEETARCAERALAGAGPAAALAAVHAFDSASPPLRAGLCRLVGRIAAAAPAPDLVEFLVARLDDPDPKTRRSAAGALGRVRPPDAERHLLAAWRREASPPARRSIAEALGKTGGAAALEVLLDPGTDDAGMRRIADRAALMIRRTLGRVDASRIDLSASPPAPLPVLLHCRAGLEGILRDEAPAELRARIVAPGLVAATLDAPPDRLFRMRTMLRFGFPVGTTRVAPGADPTEAAARLIAGERAAAVFRFWTAGPTRYRIEWSGAGHRRAATWGVALAVERLRPGLINDPSGSAWEAVVSEADGSSAVELQPKAFDDPRFAYRRRDVPAASHPTIAAALARIAGAREDDVAWDPFVGCGTELVERGLLGPYAEMHGSDVDPRALEAARENLRASGLRRWKLSPGDARRHVPAPGVTLIITNPPMGRRVPRREPVDVLHEEFLRHAALVLVPGGRLAWISPAPERAIAAARGAGLRPAGRQRVDMGGFEAEMQAFLKPP